MLISKTISDSDLATELGQFRVGEDEENLGSLLEDRTIVDVEAALDEAVLCLR